MIVRAGLSGAYGQWRNNDPHVGNENIDDFGRRFGSFYARHTAQNAGELFAGYLHHEDPRPHVSLEHGFWKRTRAAMVSVLVSNDADGNSRVALAPIAGSLAQASPEWLSRNDTTTLTMASGARDSLTAVTSALP